MVDAVTALKLIDGPRNVVVQFSNTSDGTGEAAVTKVDVSALSAHASAGPCTGVKIMGVKYHTVGMSVKILWDANADTIALEVPAGVSDSHDYRKFGGLQNDAGAGKTGDIKFTTIDHTDGDTYRITLEMVKDYA